MSHLSPPTEQVQRLTRFEEIHEPLSIAFEGLSMNIGETRILENLSGAIYAKNTTALVRTSSAGSLYPEEERRMTAC
jgi:hypothetical protein